MNLKEKTEAKSRLCQQNTENYCFNLPLDGFGCVMKILGCGFTEYIKKKQFSHILKKVLW